MSEIIHVAAAAIINENNEVLISRRADNVHQGGLWEFPGGKIERGESTQQALQRELKEELNIKVTSLRPLIKITHHYSDKSVLLDVWRVDDYEGTVIGNEGQPIQWCAASRLDTEVFPAADVPIIQALNLPENYLITGDFESLAQFEQHFSHAIDTGIKLVQLRLKKDWLLDGNESLASQVIACAKRLSGEAAVTLMFNVPDEVSSLVEKENIHINSLKLASLDIRPDCKLLSASCHTAEELEKAEKIGVNFVVLSPVQLTKSHPDTLPLGWEKFSELAAKVNLPVYALGGVTRNDVEKAWAAGAQGIAAIGALWNIN